jgi:2-polyprenyl-3-methyl-5-hydroxy-6-metoxy-1,4-benzoquinol methylase
MIEDPSVLETVPCYFCDSTTSMYFIEAEEDLTGKPGLFTFVRCNECGLVYQNPRIDVDHIKAYYDDEYIAHRRRSNWGLLTPLFEWAMDKHDRDKERIVSRYMDLSGSSAVLDVGCAVGTFLQKLHKLYGATIVGVDFKDLSSHPALRNAEFHCGLFYEQEVGNERFDLITMWHFLEHDYDPMRSLRKAGQALKRDGRLIIEVPRLDSRTFQMYGNRWPGLQAPQHTVIFDHEMLVKFVERAGFEVVEYLPYGAFPAYFYLFAGAAFKLLKGQGLNLQKAIYPYFAGQLLLSPVLLFEKDLNLAMQTVVCRRRCE